MGAVFPLDLFHLAATTGMLTLLWTVQILVYPQMKEVPLESFGPYHRKHMRRICWIVGPLFVVEGLTAAVSFILGCTVAPVLQTFSLGLFLAVNTVTFRVFVRLHRRLSREPSGETITRLVRLNWIRTVLESFRWVVVVLLVLH